MQLHRPDAAKLVLRATLGGLTLFHGVDKLLHGTVGVRADLAGAGIPTILGYGVYVGEVIAPLLVLIGLFTRPAALTIAGSIAFATLAAHPHHYVSVTPLGGFAAEAYVFYALVGVAIALLGAGRYAVGHGRWD